MLLNNWCVTKVTEEEILKMLADKQNWKYKSKLYGSQQSSSKGEIYKHTNLT